MKRNILWILLCAIATIITFWAGVSHYGSVMSFLLQLTNHNTHLNEVGVKGHFEHLATETMWRFLFHAGTIGWCLASMALYWVARRREKIAPLVSRISVNATSEDAKEAVRAFSRNPRAFLVPDSGDSLSAQQRQSYATITASWRDLAQLGSTTAPVVKRLAGGNPNQPSLTSPKGIEKRFENWQPSDWIAFISISGLVILFIGYLFVRPWV